MGFSGEQEKGSGILQYRQQPATWSSAGERYEGRSITARPIFISLIKKATQNFLQKFAIPLLSRRVNMRPP